MWTCSWVGEWITLINIGVLPTCGKNFNSHKFLPFHCACSFAMWFCLSSQPKVVSVSPLPWTWGGLVTCFDPGNVVEMMLHKFQRLGFKRPSNFHLHPPRTLPPRQPRKETRLPYRITQLTASTRHVTEAILDLPVQLSLHAWVSPGKTNPQNHEKECHHYFKPLNFGVTSFAAIVNTAMLQCGNEVGK